MAARTARESTKSTEESIFSDFLGEYVKAPYRDGDQFKIARGKLVSVDHGFVKIVGDLGTIIINEKNIEKMSRVSTGSGSGGSGRDDGR